jgi:glycosyltransferase involved in cell wall biosynthesis
LSFEHSQYTEKTKWQILLDRILSYLTDKIIVATQSVIDFTSEQTGIKINKFIVIPNPVVLPRKDEVDLNDTRNQLNLPLDSFIVLTVGRFSEEKGQKYLIDAAKKIIKDNNKKNVIVLLVGYGPLEDILREQVNNLGIEDNCKIIVDPLRAKEYFYLANLFVLPSLREGQSIVLYEAMTSGLPVIASNIGGPKDIIKNNISGLLVSPKNVDDLADKIMYLYDNIELRKLIAAKGRESVQKYNIDNNIQELENLVIELCNPRSKEANK